MSASHDAVPPPLQMLQIMMGHWVGQTAAVIARLEIPDHLAAGPRTSGDLARLASADRDALHRLLRAAASVGIVRETDPGVFASTPLGETLRKDAPGSLRDLVIAELAPGHWLPWGRLYDAVKTGRGQAKAALGVEAWEYYAKTPDEGACFARGMSNLSAIVAAQVLPAYDFSAFERIVDLGGSQGVLLAGALRAAPRAKGVLFDRPEVIDAGRDAVRALDVSARIEAVGGDFLRDVPAQGDLYLLKQVLHDWDDDRSVVLLKNVARAARPGAKLLVVEMVVPDTIGPPPFHLMDLNMLVMLDGRERSQAQFVDLLGRGGWTLQRVLPTHGLFTLLEAVPT